VQHDQPGGGLCQVRRRLQRDRHCEPARLDVAQQVDEGPLLGEVSGGNHDRCQGGDAQQPGQAVA
jgi:hypothetical protein